MENHHGRFFARLNPFLVAHKSLNTSIASDLHSLRSPSVASNRRCATKIASDEQRAKAREHQKRWREKLKTDVAKSAEYREMQRERTRYA